MATAYPGGLRKRGGLLDEFMAPDYSYLARRADLTPKQREYSANAPIDFLRGTFAGLLGTPADVANILQSPMPMEQFGEYSYAPAQKIPYGSEYFLKNLPLAPAEDNPLGRVAGQVGSFAPMVPVLAARMAGKGAMEAGRFVAPKAGLLAEQYMQGMGTMPGILPQPGRRFTKTQSPYPQQAALDLAQQRAALPVSEGGLGLPANNTPMDRARAMGGKDMVHFSRAGGDYTTLDSGQYAVAPFDAVGTHVGTPKTAMDRFRNTIATTDQIKGTTYPVTILGDRPLMNQNGMPWGEDDLNAFLRKEGGHNWSDIQGGKMTYQDMNADLRKKLFEKQGYTSIPYFNEVEGKGSISYIVPPENIRSRFAAFDPFRKDVATAAAMGVALPDLLAAETPEEIKRRQMRGLLTP